MSKAAQILFLRDKEVDDYQQEPKISGTENDTTDFVKTHSINYFLITLRRRGREERGERVCRQRQMYVVGNRSTQ